MSVTHKTDRNSISDVVDSVESTVIDLVSRFPSLAGDLLSVDYVITYGVPTAAVSRTNDKIYINPDFWRKLGRDERKFTLLHELMHIILKHNERLEGRDLSLWNIATDAVINDTISHLIDVPGSFLDSLVTTEKVYELISQHYESVDINDLYRMNEEELYRYLSKLLSKQPEIYITVRTPLDNDLTPDEDKAEKETRYVIPRRIRDLEDRERREKDREDRTHSGGTGEERRKTEDKKREEEGEGTSREEDKTKKKHQEEEGKLGRGKDKDKQEKKTEKHGEKKDEERETRDKDREKTGERREGERKQSDGRKKIMDAFRDKYMIGRYVDPTKKAGTAAGGFSRIIERFSPRTRIDWFSYLQDLIKKTYGIGSVITTWKRPSRRMGDDVPYRTLYRTAPLKSVVLIDVSGSIDDKLLRHFIEETAGAFESLKVDPSTVTLVFWDTAVRNVVTLDDVHKNIKTTGGGGTAIDDALRYAIKEEPDLVIVFTDGIIGTTDETQELADSLAAVARLPIFVYTDAVPKEFKSGKWVLIHYPVSDG